MSLFELFIIAVGLSMDAFAVAVCKGLSIKKIKMGQAAVVGLYFGTFQAGMPLIGYTLGRQFQENIVDFDHWIAFALLFFIGISMILEGWKSACTVDRLSFTEQKNASLSIVNMFLLALSTSIDAMAVGVTFAFLQVNIVTAVTLIGIITFVLSLIGARIGSFFGIKFKSGAEFAGGLILILLGVNILLEHLRILQLD